MYVDNDLIAVRLGEFHGNRVVEYDIKCCLCGTIFTRYRYNSRSSSGYVCDSCKEIHKKEQQERQKAKQKSIEEKALKRFRKDVCKAKKDMCEHFCIIPRMFSDGQVKKEACTNCPFLRIEGSAE